MQGEDVEETGYDAAIEAVKPAQFAANFTFLRRKDIPPGKSPLHHRSRADALCISVAATLVEFSSNAFPSISTVRVASDIRYWESCIKEE